MSTSAALKPLVLILPCCLALVWADKVWRTVPESYLDEVFHVRQAKAYVQGRWDVWDPKITTPPGLYLVSWLQAQLGRALDYPFISDKDFRSVNAVASLLLVLVVHGSLFSIAGLDDDQDSDSGSTSKADRRPPRPVAELYHTVINITLFPPLFFFYGLYYTDVLSALSVLYAYRCHLLGQRTQVVIAGLVSLLFRQTNIFWVAVFLGGLDVCRNLPKGRPGVEFPSKLTFRDVIYGSYQHSCAYDPLVKDAFLEDYFESALSLGVSSMIHVQRSLQSLAPYVLLLCVFLAFVIWNGGVVLGDKENHTASIHLAQMLYIWPYFTFFSFPLLYPYLFSNMIPQALLARAMRIESPRSSQPRLIIAMPVLAVMTAIVHYNTIIHPFTLADNRHYTFYVFRVFLRYPMAKYLVVPIYFICAWLVLTALGGISNARQEKPPSRDSQLTNKPKEESGNRASFLLVWLITTTLSLCTAPLVEPRYCIVPWLIWRMGVPTLRLSPSPPYQADQVTLQDTCSKSNSLHNIYRWYREMLWEQHDHRLWLETLWFLVINAVIGYIFLYWGFEWVQEPGKVMRFMW